MGRLDDLIVLRNSVDDEIRSHIPNARYRTAHEWLLMLPPDLNASLHRAELDAELARGTGGSSRYEQGISARMQSGPEGARTPESPALDQHPPLRGRASRAH